MTRGGVGVGAGTAAAAGEGEGETAKGAQIEFDMLIWGKRFDRGVLEVDGLFSLGSASSSSSTRRDTLFSTSKFPSSDIEKHKRYEHAFGDVTLSNL